MENKATGKMPRWLDVIRMTIRPFVTYALTILWIYAFLHPAVFGKEEMSMLNTILLIIYAFWFGERAITNTGIIDVFNKNLKAKKDIENDKNKDI